MPRAEDAVAAARQRFDITAGRLAQALIANVRIHRADFQRAAGRLNPQPLRLAIARRADALERLAADQRYFVYDQIHRRRERLATQAKLLQSLSYRETLKRGFALVRTQATVIRCTRHRRRIPRRPSPSSSTTAASPRASKGLRRCRAASAAVPPRPKARETCSSRSPVCRSCGTCEPAICSLARTSRIAVGRVTMTKTAEAAFWMAGWLTATLAMTVAGRELATGLASGRADVLSQRVRHAGAGHHHLRLPGWQTGAHRRSACTSSAIASTMSRSSAGSGRWRSFRWRR